MTHTHDDAWVRLGDVPADLGAFVDAVGHEPLRIDVGHTTLHVTRRGEQFHADCYGRGGGWFDERRMSRRELVHYVEQAPDPVRLKRPESQRPGGEA